jgi:hypothetical protein
MSIESSVAAWKAERQAHIDAAVVEWKEAGRAFIVRSVGRKFEVCRGGSRVQTVGLWGILRLYWKWSRRGRVIRWEVDEHRDNAV